MQLIPGSSENRKMHKLTCVFMTRTVRNYYTAWHMKLQIQQPT